MPNSLPADEFVGQSLHISGLTAQEYHFKARIVIQMGVQRRDHEFVMFMLQISEFFGEKASVVVVDQGDGSHHRSFRSHHRGSNQLVPDQVTERFRPVLVAFIRNELIETLQ